MDLVKETVEDRVFTIFLNRPEKRNALNTELLRSLKKSVLNAEKSLSKVVILRGAARFFSAGGDIKEFLDAQDPKSKVDSMVLLLNEIIKRIRSMPAIWVSVIEGGAIGAGLGLALSCDITVASKSSYINMGYGRIGLTPDGGVSIFLTRLLGLKRMNELFFFSKNMPVEKAKEEGIINFVFEDGEIDSKVAEIASELKKVPSHVIGAYKELVNGSIFPDLSNQLERERFYVSEMAGKESFKEILIEFLKKKG
jgi:2-(1,2-epoxy-1,2-dihydrophenyl)acetyl-CoA isomerase